MDEILLGMISGAAWDALKRGSSITVGYLKEKLSKWILSDSELETIREALEKVPLAYQPSEGLIREYLKLNEKIMKICEKQKLSHITVGNVHDNEGNVVIGNGNNVAIKYVQNRSQKRMANDPIFSLFELHNLFNPVQLVKSFSSSRTNYETESCRSINADIFIPTERKDEGDNFVMLLFSYKPSENWEEFYNKGYRMAFDLVLSETINKICLQIKNSSQTQFVDIELPSGKFDYLLSRMSDNKENWSDIKEICFVVFANDDYINGEYGSFEIKDFCLKK
ncbi:MAG: hypothetical protein ACLU6W_05275 [Lachnospiraceae bacterium]